MSFKRNQRILNAIDGNTFAWMQDQEREDERELDDNDDDLETDGT